jgi:hypothetical protein
MIGEACDSLSSGIFFSEEKKKNNTKMHWENDSRTFEQIPSEHLHPQKPKGCKLSLNSGWSTEVREIQGATVRPRLLQFSLAGVQVCFALYQLQQLVHAGPKTLLPSQTRMFSLFFIQF